MKRIDELTEKFKTKLERFVIGCDAVEENGQWDKDEHGKMDVFYLSDMVGVIIRLIASDGEINEKEVRYLNENFGFIYTVDELTGVYESCREEIERSVNEDFANGITYMRGINEKLAEAYKELLGLICDIIIESDGVTDEAEIEQVRKLKALV